MNEQFPKDAFNPELSDEAELITDVNEQFDIALRFVEFRNRFRPEYPYFTLRDMEAHLLGADAVLPETPEERSRLLESFLDDIDGVFFEQQMSSGADYGYRIVSREGRGNNRGLTEYYKQQRKVPSIYRKQDESADGELDDEPIHAVREEGVAGVAALAAQDRALDLVSVYPEATKRELRQMLVESIQDMSPAASKSVFDALLQQGRVFTKLSGGRAHYSQQAPERQPEGHEGEERWSPEDKILALRALQALAKARSHQKPQSLTSGNILAQLRKDEELSADIANRADARKDLNRILRGLATLRLIDLQTTYRGRRERQVATLASVHLRNQLSHPAGIQKIEELINNEL